MTLVPRGNVPTGTHPVVLRNNVFLMAKFETTLNNSFRLS